MTLQINDTYILLNFLRHSVTRLALSLRSSFPDSVLHSFFHTHLITCNKLFHKEWHRIMKKIIWRKKKRTQEKMKNIKPIRFSASVEIFKTSTTNRMSLRSDHTLNSNTARYKIQFHHDNPLPSPSKETFSVNIVPHEFIRILIRNKQ